MGVGRDGADTTNIQLKNIRSGAPETKNNKKHVPCIPPRIRVLEGVVIRMWFGMAAYPHGAPYPRGCATGHPFALSRLLWV